MRLFRALAEAIALIKDRILWDGQGDCLGFGAQRRGRNSRTIFVSREARKQRGIFGFRLFRAERVRGISGFPDIVERWG
jgi:hypothetical protein